MSTFILLATKNATDPFTPAPHDSSVEQLPFLSVLLSNLQSNLQLQLALVLFLLVSFCVCACIGSVICYCGLRHGLIQRIMSFICGTFQHRKKGKISFSATRLFASKRRQFKDYRTKLRHIWESEEECFFIVDDDVSYEKAAQMHWCEKSIGDEVACLRGYLERDEEEEPSYTFVLYPAKQKWRFSENDETWKKLKKAVKLRKKRLRVTEKYAKCIDEEPEGQILNDSHGEE